MNKKYKSNELGIFTGEKVVILENLKSYPFKLVFPNKLVSKDIKKDLLVNTIIFDIDNTLIKTKDIAKKSDMIAMKIFSNYTDLSIKKIYQEWKNIVEKLQESKDPYRRTRKYSYAQLDKKLGTKIYKKAYNDFFQELTSSIKPNKNIINVLPYLKEYNLVAFTEDSRETTLAKLKATLLYNYFNLIITSDEIKTMKPNKDYFTKIFKTLEVTSKECLVIGDNYEKDLEIAQKLGCVTICFGQDKRADYQIKDFYQLLEILKNV